jgi:hypothetical protein
MGIADRIDQLRDYPATASERFREQLERARQSREQMDGEVNPPVKGIDRSGELTPLPRPTIVRAIQD